MKDKNNKSFEASKINSLTLPTFIIAGERRSGTTSLYYWMKQHPDIYLHPVTDMNYFISDELTKARTWRDGETDPEGWEKTHDLEDYAGLFKDSEGFSAVGHKGADLLFWKPAHARIAQFLPEAKFIITLRNPVRRAWSHYWNEVGKGREKLSFKAAIEAEEERCRKSAYARLHLSYIRRGFYRQSLEAFFQHVDPERVLIVALEQSWARPKETLMEIYKFIGVDETLGLEDAGSARNENWTTVPRPWAESVAIKPLVNSYARISEGVIVRLIKEAEKRRKVRKYVQTVFRRPASNIEMPDDVKAHLKEIYAPHISSLEAFLGREFPEWKK